MLRKWLCQADIKIHLEPTDPILIKSGYATIDGPDMVPVMTFRNGEKTYYFPGSSLKGVLRSHFERIARSLREGSVCLVYFDPNRNRNDFNLPVEAERENFGCGYRGPSAGREDNSATAYADSCSACRLFGSLRFAGRFSIGDAYPVGKHAPRTGQRNGVGIDRFTGGTVRGVLFDLMVIEGGKFEADIRLTNFELWQLAAVNFLLQDLADEMIAIGSGRSRGLGRVKASVQHYALSYLTPQDTVAGLGELVTDKEKTAYRLQDWRPEEPMSLDGAEATRRGLRHQYDVTTDWHSRLGPLAPSLAAFIEQHGPLGAV